MRERQRNLRRAPRRSVSAEVSSVVRSVDIEKLIYRDAGTREKRFTGMEAMEGIKTKRITTKIVKCR